MYRVRECYNGIHSRLQQNSIKDPEQGRRDAKQHRELEENFVQSMRRLTKKKEQHSPMRNCAGAEKC